MIKVVTIVEENQALTLIKKGTVENINTTPQFNPILMNKVKEFIYDNIGYETSPIACMSKVYEHDGELSKVWEEVSTFIPTSSNTIMFEFHMPDDMVVSMTYEDMLSYGEQLADKSKALLHEFILEEFQSKLTLGHLDGDNVISFVPFLDKSRCKFYALLNENWDKSDINLDGIKKVDVQNLSIF